MHFDILFFDAVANKYYDRTTLEKEALGGTEATVVRIAEGLGALGLKVAVVQAKPAYFEPTIGQHAFFLHADDLKDMSCRHYVQLRVNLNSHLFSGAKKYLWLHDVASKDETDQLNDIMKHNMKVIGVSRWHRNNIRDFLPEYNNITYIYNPVQESLYQIGANNTSYDKNIIVWMASPHKGLKKALPLFQEIRKKNEKMNLIIFNPGYFNLDSANISLQPGVAVYGPMNCLSVWNIVKNALCVFYPTTWDETFGLVAAESNALGVPLVTHPRAALKEVISSENQFVDSDQEVVDKVLDWNKNGRPLIAGKDEFKKENVIMEWVRLFAER